MYERKDIPSMNEVPRKSSGSHSMICMLCDTRITCPWEQEIEPVADAQGWVTLPKADRRRSSHSVCGARR